jgi:hypothetical protein
MLVNKIPNHSLARQIRIVEIDSSSLLSKSELPKAEVSIDNRKMLQKIKNLKSKLQTDLNKK